jgi:hypothetical protein
MFTIEKAFPCKVLVYSAINGNLAAEANKNCASDQDGMVASECKGNSKDLV